MTLTWAATYAEAPEGYENYEGLKDEFTIAVSDGKVLYLFSLRNTAENFAKNLETYEKEIGTVRLAPRE